jgi:hypothetical protein
MIEWQAEEQRINMALAGLQAPNGDGLLDAKKAKNESRTFVFVDESGLSDARITAGCGRQEAIRPCCSTTLTGRGGWSFWLRHGGCL